MYFNQVNLMLSWLQLWLTIYLSSEKSGTTIASHWQDVLVATQFLHGSNRLSGVLNVKGKVTLCCML